MSSEDFDRDDKRAVHIPPKFNLRGRRQLWFIETRSGVDEVVNGMLTALFVLGPLALLMNGVSFL